MTGNTSPTTPAQLFPLPVNGDDPDVPGDLSTLARAIEKRVFGVYPTQAARDTAVAGIVEEGMMAFTKDTDSLWYYTGTVWKLITPAGATVRSSHTAPVNSTGVDGDVWFQY